ncbi:DUF7832 domain-containing protein [Chitinilyticum litopenaei]|uniref:DUF7832 domain-containing protein n=1 Tax=Chitinilyticum litopenaei TaxID=1121276 RepID=UPI0005BD6F9C|nr:hypothetical protein [Chitinilyticum litopenaei]
MKLHVYDKAKYHCEEVESLGLPGEHAYHHTTFFLSWLIKNELMSASFCSDVEKDLTEYREGKASINQIYGWWDACLISDMLNMQGNAFAKAYFDFSKGEYLDDYHQYLQKELPSEFHVEYTLENETIIHRVISDRFSAWKETRTKKAKPIES